MIWSYWDLEMDYFKSKPTLTDKHNSSSSLNWWNWCSFVYESSRISAIKSFWSHQCIPHSRGHDLYTEKMTHPAIPEGISILIQTATPLTTFLIEKALGNFQNWGVSCFWGTVTFSMANGGHSSTLLQSARVHQWQQIPPFLWALWAQWPAEPQKLCPGG